MLLGQRYLDNKKKQALKREACRRALLCMPVQQCQHSELEKPAAHQSSQDNKGFFISEMQGWLKYENPINILYHIEGKKENTYVSISINTDKAFDKFQHPFILYIYHSTNWEKEN